MPDDYGPEAALARNVRAARRWHGVTQKQLSERMAEIGHPMSEAGISLLETGRRRITVSELAALSRALELSIAVLLTEPFMPREAAPERRYVVRLSDGVERDVTANRMEVRDGWLWFQRDGQPVFSAPEASVLHVRGHDG
ncbi:helix-turn-helix domain-containing protein [Streptomyces sp. cg28]|uniref:helix-turn-helix domain-containing protein n=1 Tax=Streptomyces sp. cg28 TaxID=3403457 RepID=UPI003B20DD9F